MGLATFPLPSQGERWNTFLGGGRSIQLSYGNVYKIVYDLLLHVLQKVSVLGSLRRRVLYPAELRRQVLKTLLYSTCIRGKCQHSKCRFFLPQFFPSKTVSSVSKRLSISTGFEIWPFMPACSAFCLSSSKALAVMAKIGMEASSGFSSFRMARVAS